MHWQHIDKERDDIAVWFEKHAWDLKRPANSPRTISGVSISSNGQ